MTPNDNLEKKTSDKKSDDKSDDNLRIDTIQLLLEIKKEQVDFWRLIRRSTEVGVNQYKIMRFELHVQTEGFNFSYIFVLVLIILLEIYAPELGTFIIQPVLRRTYQVLFLSQGKLPIWKKAISKPLESLKEVITPKEYRQLGKRIYEISKVIQTPTAKAIGKIVEKSTNLQETTNIQDSGGVRYPTHPSVQILDSVTKNADIYTTSLDYVCDMLIMMIDKDILKIEEVKTLRKSLIDIANQQQNWSSDIDYSDYIANLIEATLWALTYSVKTIPKFKFKPPPTINEYGGYLIGEMVERKTKEVDGKEIPLQEVFGIQAKTLDYLAKRIYVPLKSGGKKSLRTFAETFPKDFDIAQQKVAEHLVTLRKKNIDIIKELLDKPEDSSQKDYPNSPNPIVAFDKLSPKEEKEQDNQPNE